MLFRSPADSPNSGVSQLTIPSTQSQTLPVTSSRSSGLPEDPHSTGDFPEPVSLLFPTGFHRLTSGTLTQLLANTPSRSRERSPMWRAVESANTILDIGTSFLKRPGETRSPRGSCFARKPESGQISRRCPAEPHFLGRSVLGCRRPSTMRMIPTTATISPMKSHIRLPVMKLPGIRFIPCPAKTPPIITAITPMVIRAMRPTLLFTLPNVPLDHLALIGLSQQIRGAESPLS